MGGIGVLGPLTIDGTLERRERVVLAALVVRRGEVVSADLLADAVWGESPPRSWPKIVQSCVVRLRKVLGAGAIVTEQHGYRLAVPVDELDVGRFERLVGRARELLTLGEPERAAYLVDEALNLWRGEPLDELDGWEPGRVYAARLRESRLDAQELRVDAVLRAGRFRDVLAEAQGLAAEEPLRERRWELLALAQYQAGRQADALSTIRRARRVLADELGLDPGPDLVALEEAILRQDPSLVVATVLPEPSTTSPYLGLVPYGVADADGFFGRDTEVSECLRRLADSGVLAVVGPSGSGKSSLVHAGVAATLERDGRRVVIITPGPRPMDALTALRSAGPAPVLVVDQCEEAVTLCLDADERGRFFTALTEHADRSPLIVALRADRLGELSAHPAFARLVERGLYLLKRMDEDELRAAIEGPARQAGLLLEPGLIDLLIRDVEGEPGALPLLSHALRQTWARREGRTLTVEGYQASGGIRGAVAQSAEQLYEQAGPAQRPILRDLLLRLVSPSAEGEPVRSRVPRRVVAPDPEHEQVIEELVRARLVTSDEDVVEIAHEALARAWPRLRSWLDDDVEGQRIWRHLAVAADSWQGMGRPDSELYRGVRLAQAVQWRDRAEPDLNPTEQTFLDTSRSAAEAEQQASRRRRRALVVGLAAVAVLTTTLSGVAVVNQQRANEEADRADLAADAARSHALAASAISALSDDPSLAKLLAVASAAVAEPTPESMSALHQAWAADRVVARVGGIYDARLWTDLHPSGERIVASGEHLWGGASQTMEVSELATDELLWSFHVDEASAFVANPFFSTDGDHVVGGVFWGPEFGVPRPPDTDGAGDEPPPDLVGGYVWDADSGAVIDRFDLGRCGGWVTAMSDTHLLVRTLHGSLDVLAGCDWSAGTVGAELADRQTGVRDLLTADSSSGPAGPSWGAAMSGDGRYVAFDDSAAGESIVMEVATGDRVLRIDRERIQVGYDEGVRALSHDGSLLLYADTPIQVWDVATGGLLTRFHGQGGASLNAEFGRSGATVFSTGMDASVREWDARTGQQLTVYPGAGDGRLSLTADGFILVTHSQNSAALLDVRPRGELGAIETCAGLVMDDGMRVAEGMAAMAVLCGDDANPTSHVVDIDGGDLALTVPGHVTHAVEVSPDGTRFVRQDGDGDVYGPVRVLDIRSGAEVVELEGVCTWTWPEELHGQQGCRDFPEQPFLMWAWAFSWSPDGTMIAMVGGAYGRLSLVVWDAETGEVLHAEAQPHVFPGFAFTPDSRHLVTAGDWELRTLSTDTWQTVHHAGLFTDGGWFLRPVGITPDGSTLLGVGNYRGESGGWLHWFDASTLEATRSKAVPGGSLSSAALSPDGSLVATGSSDGLVRVWDVRSGEFVQEIAISDTGVQGVAFIDDVRLAVAPQEGNLLIVTVDPDELLDLVRASLTRGFTETECERFNFGDDCPTLAELRGPVPWSDDLSVLDGVYRQEQSADDLYEGFLATRAFDEDDARGLADEFAGAASFTFDGGRFDLVGEESGDTICAGTYAVRIDRLYLYSERGRCPSVKFFDARFEIVGDTLRLHDFHGDPFDQVLIAGKPLSRVE